MKTIKVIDMDILSYEQTYFVQRKILAKKKMERDDDYLLLAEHPNIFTIGRSGTKKNLLVDENLLKENGLNIIEADRGGDITFHGIGQLVAYPIFDLSNHTKDVRFFIKRLERVLELTIAEYGIIADTKKSYTGLWVNGKKIGFIGIGISKWITYHGVSLNANVDIKYFSMIRPCGIDHVKIGSLQEILNRNINLNSLKEVLVERFCEVFGFERSSRYYEDAFVAKEEIAPN